MECAVPWCGFALETERVFAGSLSGEVMGHVQGREVGGSVILGAATFAIAEAHVHSRMERSMAAAQLVCGHADRI